MTLRNYDSAIDVARLAPFTCSLGAPFEDEVALDPNRCSPLGERHPRATFQRRALGLIEDSGALVAVVAWQDIVRVDLEGLWLEVLAVSVDHQHRGAGLAACALTIDHLRTIDREGDYLGGLLHVDNRRSKRLLSSVGWMSVSTSGEHELWVGRL